MRCGGRQRRTDTYVPCGGNHTGGRCMARGAQEPELPRPNWDQVHSFTQCRMKCNVARKKKREA